MTYRLANLNDLDRLMHMAEQAIASFKAKNIDQWQKGEPNEDGLRRSIGAFLVHVLAEDRPEEDRHEEGGQAVAMITIVPGPEASYDAIRGAWLNQEPYYAFHRVCVEESRKGQGLAAALFRESERYVLDRGRRNIRIDTHPDNLPMQRALLKSGYVCCGSLILTEGSEAGDPRLGFHKVL